jgi:hypothetical protein
MKTKKASGTAEGWGRTRRGQQQQHNFETDQSLDGEGQGGYRYDIFEDKQQHREKNKQGYNKIEAAAEDMA